MGYAVPIYREVEVFVWKMVYPSPDLIGRFDAKLYAKTILRCPHTVMMRLTIGWYPHHLSCFRVTGKPDMP